MDLKAHADVLLKAVEGLNAGQKKALLACLGSDHSFLTGGAGTGKSFLVNRYRTAMRELGVDVPVVASTGAAAVLVGGQTFHRFFGLDGATDVEALVTRALAKPYIWPRMNRTESIILDEVSMLPGYALEAAYLIAQRARRSEAPWGGMGVLAVGDFRQLPPVVKERNEPKPWCFLTKAWEQTKFKPVMLTEPVRSVDPDFIKILWDARVGALTDRMRAFLDERTVGEVDEDIPRVYARKVSVENYNMTKLEALPGKARATTTEYTGHGRYLEDIRRNAPIPENLVLKPGALVMMRQNCKMDTYVNGSLGHVTQISGDTVYVKLLSGLLIAVQPSVFMLTDEMGDVLATASNYPMTLAWATTIHKSQGATMDAALLDLAGLWEAGQLYVALSRVRTPQGVKVISWNKGSFRIDKKVTEFHKKMVAEMEEKNEADG